MIASWVRLAFRTSQWDREGCAVLDAELEAGRPVILVLWHQRLMMAPYMFDARRAPICTLTSTGRAGRMAGQVQTRFGFLTRAISSHARSLSVTRDVLSQMKDGISVGIAADGPRGPARQSAMVPISWARASGARVFVVTFSARKVWQLGTWDKMWIPRLFTSGVLLCREWPQQVPRKADAEQMEALRADLERALDAVCDDADAQVGRLSQKRTATAASAGSPERAA